MIFPNLDFSGSRPTKVADDLSMDFTDDVGIPMVNLRDSVSCNKNNVEIYDTKELQEF
jgi:hypothetical protein